MDSPTIERISRLHPSIRNEVSKIINECDKALTGRAKVRITQGLRTFKEQDELFAKGRTTGKKGAIVTQSKGGQSYHNYGLAVDFCLLIDTNGDGTFETPSFDPLKDFDGDRIADWKEVVSDFSAKEKGKRNFLLLCIPKILKNESNSQHKVGVDIRLKSVQK